MRGALADMYGQTCPGSATVPGRGGAYSRCTPLAYYALIDRFPAAACQRGWPAGARINERSHAYLLNINRSVCFLHNELDPSPVVFGARFLVVVIYDAIRSCNSYAGRPTDHC